MTLKANELRIGNYVSDIHAVGTFYAEVKKLDFSRCYYGKFNSDYSDLKPIPLTEEWLLNFGFECVFTNDDYHYYLESIDLSLDRSYQPFGIGKYKLEFEYVHQLQNLYFALTGEELKLKNNSNN